MFTKVTIHDRGGLLVLERLVLHDVAPVAGRVADGEKNRFVFAARLGESFLAPGIPIDRVMGVLEKIRRLLVREAVGVLCNSRRGFGSDMGRRHTSYYQRYML